MRQLRSATPSRWNGHEFPEIDRAHWASIEQAQRLLTKAQAPLLDRLVEYLDQERLE